MLMTHEAEERKTNTGKGRVVRYVIHTPRQAGTANTVNTYIQ